jgi:Putative beta-barrel porin 2
MLLLASLILFQPSSAWAAEPVGEIVTEDSTAPIATEEETRMPSKIPFLITFGVHGGYDSNPNTTTSGSGSLFTDQQLTLAYDRLRGPLDLKALAAVGAVERANGETNPTTSLDLLLSYAASPRLTLSASINGVYTSEPNFASNVGPTQRAGNYFTTADALTAAYQWSGRFSTVSSYSFKLVRYENSATAAFSDRQENTLGEEFRFDLFRTTVLVADYRFLVVNYVSNPLDSTTNFLLAGVEHSFNRRLQGQFRGGVSFLSFDQGGSETNPDFEGSLNYVMGSHSSIGWTAQYGTEQPTQQNVASQTTFRTGLQFRYAFTGRISSAIGFNYQHNDNQGGVATAGNVQPTGGSFATDAYDVLVDLRYQINRHADVDLGLQHSESTSANPTQDYSRNIYSIGLNFTF